MLLASLALLPWTAGDWQGLSLREFFLGGPHPLCSECVLRVPEGEECRCLQRRGWDGLTALAVVAIVVNGLTTGLTLRYLSAVTKSVCNALSSGVFYIIYVWLGFSPFSMAQANIVAIVCISTFEYAMEKIENTRVRRQAPSFAGNSVDAIASSQLGICSVRLAHKLAV
mmetsp:Transcript_126901/g.395026  ORF Transcript_126901/g.395026 Transcript_126901/m.395026 type:complete len:169 (+) Transcript_126901:810-1316(+)